MQYNHEEFKKQAKQLVEESRGYMVILSSKDVIKVDSDEIRRITEGISTGSIIRTRKGLINPSFIVSVVEDTKRNSDFVREVDYAIKNNEFLLSCGDTTGYRNLPKINKYKDIFHSVLPEINDEKKRLN